METAEQLLKSGDQVEPHKNHLTHFWRNDYVRKMVVDQVLPSNKAITLKSLDGHQILRRGGGKIFLIEWVEKT